VIVTHTDGYPVMPQRTYSMILGMGERADAMITIGSSVLVVAALEGKDGCAQLNLRVGGKPADVNIDEFVKTLRTTPTLNTATLTPTPEVFLPQRTPDMTLEMALAGPVNGYTWPVNGKLYDPPNNGMAVAPGKRVRVKLISESRMFHPIHLHGHTFQVVQPSALGARKDTVLVPPLQTVEFDFDTDNPGRWITHCHNDYHLGSGMATFIECTG
jgi:FtsP/CotA-like multicopper oxidase with cupredoxin domain